MGHGARGAAPKERGAADGAGARGAADGAGARGAAPKERGAADGAGARGCKGVALPPGFFVVF